MEGLIFVGTNFRCFRGGSEARIAEATKYRFSVNTMTTNFELHECVIFVQSMKISTHENKAIHSKLQI